MPRLYADGQQINTYRIDPSAIMRVHSATSYLDVSKQAVEHLVRRHATLDGYVRRGEAFVHETARVSESAQLVGPVLVERQCEIGPEAMVVGPSTIGENSTIGAKAVVSRSVVWENATVSTSAVIDHCVVTDGGCVDPCLVGRKTIFLSPKRRRSATVKRSKLVFWRRSESADTLNASSQVGNGGTDATADTTSPTRPTGQAFAGSPCARAVPKENDRQC